MIIRYIMNKKRKFNNISKKLREVYVRTITVYTYTISFITRDGYHKKK